MCRLFLAGAPRFRAPPLCCTQGPEVNELSEISRQTRLRLTGWSYRMFVSLFSQDSAACQETSRTLVCLSFTRRLDYGRAS